MQLTSGMVGEERRGEERRGEEKAHIISFLGEVFVSSHAAFLRDGCPCTSHHRTNGYPVVELEGRREERRGKEGRREGSDRGK